jgi:hypothetical protein
MFVVLASVARALEVQRVIADARLTETQKACAIGKDPDVAQAYSFWVAGAVACGVRSDGSSGQPDDDRMYGPLSENALAVAELEALVLARKKPEHISKHTGLSASAVRWYEALWFDVRDRLCRPGWVSAQVIGSLHQGSVATLLPALVRAYGYYSKSTRTVRQAVTGFDPVAARQAARDNPDRFFAADAIAAGGLKAALAIRLMPLVDRKVYGRVIELHQEALRIQADTAEPTGGADQARWRESFAKLQSKIDLTFGGKNQRALPGLRVTAVDDEADVG